MNDEREDTGFSRYLDSAGAALDNGFRQSQERASDLIPLLAMLAGFLPGAGMADSLTYGRRAANNMRAGMYASAAADIGAGAGFAAMDLIPGGAAARSATKPALRAIMP